LDVRDGVVVKGTRFRNHEVVGEIIDLAIRYRDEGADEIVFYDISASPEGRKVSRKWVQEVAQVLNIPFCVAGGIRSTEDAMEILHSGADKISINTPALENPHLITELSRRFGQQCVVIGVDSIRVNTDYEVRSHTGCESTLRSCNRKTMDWIKEVQDRGAGEIVLNCMDQDGTGSGYDILQLRLARECVSLPLIASGGAKTIEDFRKVFQESHVDGALAAGAFHYRLLDIPTLKKTLAQQKIEIRL
jgi:cyclase